MLRTRILWVGLCGLMSLCGSAIAKPAHYVVFEFDAAGIAVPVFHARVELAVDHSTLVDQVKKTSDTETEQVIFRPILNGVVGAERQIAVPRYRRAEFAHDAESGVGEIEHHPNVEDDSRAFVLRVAVEDADSVELVTDAGPQQIDLVALERNAADLPLADVPLARAVESERAELSPAAANSGNRIDILVLGDGYTSAEQGTFNTHAAALQTQMFNVSPYKEYASFINWQTGFVASAQSGADHPPYQAACTTTACCSDTAANSDPRAGMFVSTALDSRFCTNQIHRLLVSSNSKVYAAAAGFPNWDQILVTVNDPVYGGAGGAFGVTSAHTSGPLVVIHEFAHSFHKLADEYDSAYPGFPACSDLGTNQTCEANVTNQTNASLVKWRSWFTPGIAIPTPSGTAGTGLFQGARYQTSGMYRPVHNSCLMRVLGSNFCTVCRQQYVKHLYKGAPSIVPAAGIDLIEPGSEIPSHTAPVLVAIGASRTFTAEILRPTIGTVNLQWYLDGAPIAGATSASYTFAQTVATPATRTLQLRATDQTTFVHATMADGLLAHTRAWTIQVTNDRLFAHGFE